MANRNRDVLGISFDAKEGLKALENNIMSAMEDMSNEMQTKLEEAFLKAGRNPKLKKQLTGVYQGLFDELASSAGDLDEANKAIDRFVGKIDYLNDVVNKTRSKNGKLNTGLLDGLSIKDIDNVLDGYDKVIEKRKEIARVDSNEFKDNKRFETTIKSLKELERTYGDTGKAKEKYEGKVNDYLKNVGIDTSVISKEIKEYASLIALFEKINDTKINAKVLEKDPDAAIKKSQALLYVMQQIANLEKGNALLGKFRIDESDIKNLKSSVTVLSQQVEGSINNFVKGITKTLQADIDKILLGALAKAEKASQHQFISAQKTQAKIDTGSGTGDAKGDIFGDGKGGSSNELDLWEESAKNLGEEFVNLNKYAKNVEDTFNRLNELWKSYDKGLSMTEDEVTEMWGLMKRFDELKLNGLTGNLKLSEDQLDEFKEWATDDQYSKLFGRISNMTKSQLAEIEKLKAAQKDVGSGTAGAGGINDSKVEELSKEIAEVKEDITSLKGRVDTLEDTTAFDTLSSQVEGFDEKIKNTNDSLLNLKKTVNELTGGKALGQVITDMSKHGRENEGSGELLAYSSSSTGYTSDIGISDSATGITKEFREEVYNRIKAEAEAIDTQIHSHPDNEIAAASYDDIGVMIRQLEEGVTKQAVTSLSQVMTFDFDSTNLSNDELKTKLLSVFEEYKKWVFKYFSPIDENGKLHELAPLTDEMENKIVEYAKELLKIFPNMDEDLLDSDVTQKLFQDKIKELFSKNGLGDVVKLSNLADIESSFSFSDIRKVADSAFSALTSKAKQAVKEGYADGQDSHSPSKEAEKLNDDFVAGIEESANKNANKLNTIGKQMADDIKEGFKDGMSEVGTTALSDDNQSSVLLGDDSVEKLEQDLKDIYKWMDKISSEDIVGEHFSSIYDEDDLKKFINLLNEIDRILGEQPSDFRELTEGYYSKYFNKSYLSDMMDGLKPETDEWYENESIIKEDQQNAIMSVIGAYDVGEMYSVLIDNAIPAIQSKLEEMFTLDPNALRQHFEDYGGIIRNAIGEAYYEWDEKLFPTQTSDQSGVLLGTDKELDEIAKSENGVNDSLNQTDDILKRILSRLSSLSGFRQLIEELQLAAQNDNIETALGLSANGKIYNNKTRNSKEKANNVNPIGVYGNAKQDSASIEALGHTHPTGLAGLSLVGEVELEEWIKNATGKQKALAGDIIAFYNLWKDKAGQADQQVIAGINELQIFDAKGFYEDAGIDFSDKNIKAKIAEETKKFNDSLNFEEYLKSYLNEINTIDILRNNILNNLSSYVVSDNDKLTQFKEALSKLTLDDVLSSTDMSNMKTFVKSLNNIDDYLVDYLDKFDLNGYDISKRRYTIGDLGISDIKDIYQYANNKNMSSILKSALSSNGYNINIDDYISSMSYEQIYSYIDKIISGNNEIISSAKQALDAEQSISQKVDKTEVLSGDGIQPAIEEQQKIQEELQQTQQEAKETAEVVVTAYRGIMKDITDKYLNSYWTSDIAEAQYFASQMDDVNDDKGEVLKSKLTFKKPFTIDVNGRGNGDIRYIGDGADEVSKKLIVLNEQFEETTANIKQKLKTLGFEDVNVDLSNLNKNLDTFFRVKEPNDEFIDGYTLKVIRDADEAIEYIGSHSKIGSQELEKLGKELKRAFDVGHQMKEIFRDDSNPYTLSNTDTVRSRIEATGKYDGIIYKNIYDASEKEGGATHYIPISESQISELENLGVITEEAAKAHDKLQAELQETRVEVEKTSNVVSQGNQTPLSSPSMYEDSDGQLSFVEQTKKTVDLIEEESGQMSMFENVAEKATDSAIEGQMTLNDVLNKNIEGQMTLNDLVAKQDATAPIVEPIKDTFDVSTSDTSTEQHASDIKSETDAIKENTNALKENAQAQKKQSETKEGASDTRIHDVNKAWTAAVRENKVFDENKTRLAIKNYEELIGKLERYYSLLGQNNRNDFIDGSAEKAELESLKNQIDKASKSIDEFKGKGKDFNEIVKKFKISIGELDKKSGLTDLYRKDGRNDIFENLSSDNVVSSKINGYEQKVNDLKTVFLEIKNLVPIDITNQKEVDRLDELNKQFDELAQNLNSDKYDPANQSDINKWTGKISDTLFKNTNAPKEIRRDMEALVEQLKQVGLSQADIRRIKEEFERLESQMKATGKTGDSLGTKIKKKFKDVAAYFATYVSIQDAIQVIRQGFETIKEYDTALTEMTKVSEESISTLKEFQKESFELADSIGTTAQQIQNSTADFMRLGESLEVAKQSAQDANILFNVSEFGSIDEATEALVSMSQAYKELEKGEIVDVVNNLGNNFAISTDGLATALQNSASALTTAQNDFYEAAALTTAANTVVQDPDKVGAGKLMPEHIVICGYFIY